MKRRTLLTLTLLALATLFSLGIAIAAQPTRLLFPLVVYGQASVCDGTAPIHAGDTGALSAIRDADGRYIVAYQDRAHGSVAHVAQHVGGALEELAAPVSLAVLPQFSPDGPKQGSVALVASASAGGKSRLYYTQRTPADAAANEGPYAIWCMEF